MIDFLFIYEHKAREIESLCLLKAALEEKGYSVDIVQAHELNLIRYRFSFWRKPRVVVPFALYDEFSFERHVTDIVGPIKKVVNMHWEQALSKNYIDSGFPIPTGIAADAVHICWGNDGYRLFKENGIKNAVMTGAVQMDFLRDKLKGIYLSREEINERFHLPPKKMLLFISTFVYASMIPEEQIRLEKIVGTSLNNKIEQGKKAKTAVLKWLDQFLKEDEDYYVIYRPHPGENIDNELLRYMSCESRFLVISEDSIKQWIVVADKIATFYSTAVAEGYYAHKDCTILRPVPIDKGEDVIMFEGAEFITTYEDMKEAIINCDGKFPIPTENITNCYGQMDGRLAYEKIVDLLEEVLKTNKYDLKVSKGRFNFKGPIRRYIKKILKKINLKTDFPIVKNIPRLKEKLEFLYYSEKKFRLDYVSPSEIGEKTALYKSVLSK